MIQSVDRALIILEYLKGKSKGSGVTEIATQLQIAKSSAHRLLATLEMHNYVQKTNLGHYALGLKFIEMNHYVVSNLDILTIAHPLLERLCDEVDEIVHLVQLRNNEIVYIDKVETKQSIRIYSQIGRTAQLYCTGVGKVILAFQQRDFVERYLDSLKEYRSYTEYTVKNRVELEERLHAIRKLGYGFDNQEHELDISCIAAPIFNYSNKVSYAISVTSQSLRLTEEKIEAIIPHVLKCAKEISKQLGRQSF